MANDVDDAGDLKEVWIEEAERRYQEILRGEIDAEESYEVFAEARARLR